MLGNLPQIMALAINTYTGSTVIPSEDLAPWSWDTGSHSRATRGDFRLSVLLLGGRRQRWLVEEWWAVHHPREDFCPARLRSQRSQWTKEKVYKGGRDKSCTMGAPIVGPRSGNRNANRIFKSRLSVEEGYPVLKMNTFPVCWILDHIPTKRPSSGLLSPPFTHPAQHSGHTSVTDHLFVLQQICTLTLTICKVLEKLR